MTQNQAAEQAESVILNEDIVLSQYMDLFYADIDFVSFGMSAGDSAFFL